MQRHSHASMHEVFYVLSGRGVFLIDDVPHTVANGSFVHVRLWLPLLLLGSGRAVVVVVVVVVVWCLCCAD